MNKKWLALILLLLKKLLLLLKLWQRRSKRYWVHPANQTRDPWSVWPSCAWNPCVQQLSLQVQIVILVQFGVENRPRTDKFNKALSSAMFWFMLAHVQKSANQMATKYEWLKWRLTCRANNKYQNFHSSFIKIVCHVHLLFTFDTFGWACGRTFTCHQPIADWSILISSALMFTNHHILHRKEHTVTYGMALAPWNSFGSHINLNR